MKRKSQLRRFKYQFLLIPFLLISWGFKPKEGGISRPLVVVELFTSQGCSSCPPADLLLARMDKENDVEVMFLSFHVAYWNYLGWKDPFSKEFYTKRQRKYNSIIGEGIYTPQTIVNGSYACVGSKEINVRSLIEKSRTSAHHATIEFNVALNNVRNGWNIEYTLASNDQPLLLNIAQVQSELVTAIKRGENGGRTLKNHNVVLDFKTVTTSSSGSVSIDPVENADFVAVYLQNPDDLSIVSARKIDLK